MPTEVRTERVNLKVRSSAKKLAIRIAQAMTKDEIRWTETDIYEQGVLALAGRRDVREALKKAEAATGQEGDG